jgi:hypothetical protein
MSGDFNFTLEGEALTLPTLVCSTPEKRDSCGCGRAFSGIESSKATTFGVVAEVAEDEIGAFRDYFWASPHVDGRVNEECGPDEVAPIMWVELEEISRLLEHVAVDTEVRVDVLQTQFAIRTQSSGSAQGARSDRITDLIDAWIRSTERQGSD